MPIPRTIPPILTKTEWNELIAYLTAGSFTGNLRVEGDLSVVGSSAFSGSLYLTGSNFTIDTEAPALTNLELMDDIVGWDNKTGSWNPAGLPTGSAPIIFKDSTSLNIGSLFGIRSSENSDNILLSTDVSLLVQKDISVGGFVGANQGAILLGHGLSGSYDYPKILLTHAPSTGSGLLPTNSLGGFDTLWIEKYNENGSTGLAKLKASEVYSDIISGATGNTINFKSNIYPSVSTLTLGSYAFPWSFLDTHYVFTDNISCFTGSTLTGSANLYITGNLTVTGSVNALGYANTSPSIGTGSYRLINTVYQNTTNGSLIVYCAFLVTGSATDHLYGGGFAIGSTNPPLSPCGRFSNSSVDQDVSQTIIVPKNWYYELYVTGSNIVTWQEMML